VKVKTEDLCGDYFDAHSPSREALMQTAGIGPEIEKSALIIVDMQNDFLHRDGNFSHIAREHPEFRIDMPFLIGTIPKPVKPEPNRLK
jgi:hypothetical protein